MILFILLAYSFVVLLRTDGPFDLIQKTRKRLFDIEFLNLGHFFYKLLECPYCIGFWCSLLAAIICFPVSAFTICWAFIGAVVVFLIENLLSVIQVV